METLPPRGRPVTEEGTHEVSPESLERLRSLLREAYRVRPSTRSVLPRQAVPTKDEMRAMLASMSNVEPLHGAKVLYVDDASQCYLPFVAHLTLATRRRVERIFYHVETVQQIVDQLRQRIRLCPRPHLLILDQELNMLPTLEFSGTTIHGDQILRHALTDLRGVGITTIGYTTDGGSCQKFLQAGADGFVGKRLAPHIAVERMAAIQCFAEVERARRKRAEELFLLSD